MDPGHVGFLQSGLRDAGLKRCTRCGEEKPAVEGFYWKKGKPGSHCRKCHYACAKPSALRNREKAYERTRRWRANNPDKVKAYSKAYYAEHAEECREKSAVWRAENPDKLRARVLAYGRSPRAAVLRKRRYDANPEKFRSKRRAYARKYPEKVRAYATAYAKANPAKRAANQQRREADKIKATPPWANLAAIEAVYVEAARLTRETGVPHHVDHIYPLRGKDGSRGLHVEYNLQILPAVVNLRKSNRAPT